MLFSILLNQTCFQVEKYYNPHKNIVMRSAISSTATDIYLQYEENLPLKKWIETKAITCTLRYLCRRHPQNFLPTKNKVILLDIN
jgi:hypothetical protein